MKKKELHIYCPKMDGDGLRNLLQYAKKLQCVSAVFADLHHLPMAEAVANQYPSCQKMSYHLLLEPVQIELDHHHGYLRLLPRENLTEAVTATLTSLLETFAAEKNVTIHFLAAPKAWLLSSNQPLTHQQLCSPFFICRHSIANLMPELHSVSVLSCWFNELQMLLYQMPLAKEAGVNSFWFWGNGGVKTAFDGIISQDWYWKAYAVFQASTYRENYTADIFQSSQKVLFIPEVTFPLSATSVTDDSIFASILQDFYHKKIDNIFFYFSEKKIYLLERSVLPKWLRPKLTLEEIWQDEN